MCDQPLLTVAVPTYNGSRTIRSMLDLLLPQVTDEVEVIVSDNCSTDDTPQIIREYQAAYPFIRYVRNERNLQADGNFLQCTRIARGRFVMLISDDDIITEGAIGRILDFLRKNPQVSLAFLESASFRDHYVDIAHCEPTRNVKKPLQDIVTTDKGVFLDHSITLFGFTSSYVWSKERLMQIDNPEQYFGTYFLQAYLCIRCSDRPDDVLGVIHGPNIGVGCYGIIGNYDTAEVEGLFWHRMMEDAVAAGYPRRKMEQFYVWKIIFLCRNSIVRERAVGVKKTHVKNVLKATWQYPRTWIELYPFLFAPPFVCRMALRIVRKRQGRTFSTYVNRPTEKTDKAEKKEEAQ